MGEAAADAGPEIDLDGDSDQTGEIEGSRSEEAAETESAVLVLANCDDDDRDGLPDSADSRINGARDAADLEPVLIRRRRGATTLGLRLRLLGLRRPRFPPVRVYSTGGAEILGPEAGLQYELSPADLASLEVGDLTLLVEGLDFAEEVTLELRRRGGGSDRLRLRVAPLVLLPHTQEAVENAASQSFTRTSRAFVESFREACLRAGVEPRVARSWDVWMEDEMQWGVTRTARGSMPVVLHMHRQRPLALWVEDLLAPDVGYYRPFPYPSEKNALDYGGNLEVSPPTAAHPSGRIYFGGRPSVDTPIDAFDRRKMHPRLQGFLRRQRVQSPVALNTDWLAVGHVDELVTFLPDATRGSFVMAVASPRLALELLRDLDPETELDRRYLLTFGLASVADVLDLSFLLRSFEDYNLDIEARISGADPERPDPRSVKGRLMAALDLTEDRVVELPVLFHNLHPELWKASALTPNLVNVSSMTHRVLAPDPHLEAFRTAAQEVFDRLGLATDWIDDWSEYHARLGNVHCGTNERRRPFSEGGAVR